MRAALALVALFLISAIPAYAGYVPLVGLPAVEGSGTGLAGYFNQLYMVTIAAGAILAFLKISMAGVKWSMSEIVTDISDAKKDINGALFGLAILLIPFIVLNTIYPGLTNLDVLKNSTGVRIDPRVAPTTNTQVSTDPNVITRPQDIKVSEVFSDWSCIVRGGMIPGTENNLAGPEYSPDSYDCQAQIARCAGSEYNYGKGVEIVPDRKVRCTYLEATPPSTASCSLGGPC